MKPTKEQIIALLGAWIRQRPGLDYGNYGDPVAYRAEVRSIGQDLQHARTLLRAVELSSIDADTLIEGFRAFSGRLSLEPIRVQNAGYYGLSDDAGIVGWKLDYTTGQYWPTEYRRAACAVLASALWAHYRDSEPDNVYTSAAGVARKGDQLRASFKRRFGRTIANRCFN